MEGLGEGFISVQIDVIRTGGTRWRATHLKGWKCMEWSG